MASRHVFRGIRSTQRMVSFILLEACGTRGKAPFKSILSHGFVVDGKGMKMSKSMGNVISPEEILKNMVLIF